MTRPKSRTVISSQTFITRSMWCSTSITDIRSVRPRISSPSSSHLVGREAAGRLVEQQQGRLRGQRPGQGDPLADGVREAGRVAVGVLLDADGGEDGPGAVAQLALLPGRPGEGQQRGRGSRCGRAGPRRP